MVGWYEGTRGSFLECHGVQRVAGSTRRDGKVSVRRGLSTLRGGRPRGWKGVGGFHFLLLAACG